MKAWFPFPTAQRGSWRAGLYLSLAACLLIGYLLASHTLSAIRAVRILEQHVVSSAAPGPRRVSGRARRSAEIVSPLGQRGVGWAGSVWYWKIGKRSRRVELCGRGDLGEVLVDDGTQARRLDLVRPGQSLTVMPEASPYGGPRVYLGLPVSNGSVPDEIAASCAKEIAAADEVDLHYAEAMLVENQHIEVLACADESGTLGPCHDGFDLLTIASVDTEMATARHERVFFAVVAVVWNAFVLFAATQLLRCMRRSR